MATDPDKLKRFLTALDGENLGLTEADFIKAFEGVVGYVKQIDQKLSTDLERALASIKQLQKDMRDTNDLSVADMKKMLDQLFVGERVSQIEAKLRTIVDEKMRAADKKMSEIRSGRDGNRGDRGQAGRDGSPDTAQQIAGKLETLKGNERLSVNAIDGLDDHIKSISRASGGGGPVFVPSGAGTTGKIVRYYDLSASLDGATKVFTLPAFHRIIAIHCSSQPFILRPDTDWTANAGTMVLTFTSAVDETITLATGQSLIIVYAEN